MKKHILGICGSFGANAQTFDGQTVKTKNLTTQLEKTLGTENVYSFNTHFWRKSPFKVLFGCIKASKNCKCVIIMPAQNGLKVFAPLFVLLKKLFKNRLYYSVIGGWLPEWVNNYKGYLKIISQFDEIFVETQTMKDKLSEIGLNNVSVVVNFKLLTPVKADELRAEYSEPYRLCTFSRVTEQKGILDAARVVAALNQDLGRTVYTLDIYGSLDPAFAETFEKEMSLLPDSICYKGCANSSESVQILSQYFAQLFPTKFITEGFPGSIIDSYFAATPDIASHWNSCCDIVEHMYNGIVFDFADFNALKDILQKISDNPQLIIDMKKNCLVSADVYKPEATIRLLLERMGLNE